jgi:hypothetical protein
MIQDKMDFSMHIIRKLFYFLSCLYLLAGCTGRDYVHQDDVSTGAPAYLQYGGFNMGLYGTSDDTHRMAVLLPTSGSNAEIGKSIRLGIEAAAVRFAPNGLQISFYDTGQGDIIQAIESALSENPEMIIGPVFAGDAKMLRDNKPARIPALSFTSDTTAVGNGVFSMALMPSNGIEAILQEMAENTNKKLSIYLIKSTLKTLVSCTTQNATQIPLKTLLSTHHFTPRVMPPAHVLKKYCLR